MARDWQPGVYPRGSKAKPPFWVKFKVWERRFEADPWSRKKGFAKRADARAEGEERKNEWRKKAAGLWNPQVEHASKPLQEFVDKFVEHVHLGLRQRVRRRASAYAQSPKRILGAAAEAMGAKTIGDLSRESATKWLSSLRTSLRPASLREYRAMLDRFGRWLEDGDVVAKSPFRGLPRIPTDDREHRQALNTEQVLLLARGAIQRVLQKARGPKVRQMALPHARKRALVIVTTFLTTMRNTTMGNFAWSWIDEQAGCIRVPAEWVKRPGRPRPQCIPLHSELAKLLREIRRERALEFGRPIAGDELVVGERDAKGFAKLPDTLAENLRRDAKQVGIQTPDAEGRILDLMAMRTSCATELRRLGVVSSIISEIMHTARTSIAERHYIHADEEKVLLELRGFLDRIPFKAEQVRGLLFDVPAEPAGTRAPRATPDPVSSSSPQSTIDTQTRVSDAT